MAAPGELLNLKILAHDQSGNQREAIWSFDDDSVPTTVRITIPFCAESLSNMNKHVSSYEVLLSYLARNIDGEVPPLSITP